MNLNREDQSEGEIEFEEGEQIPSTDERGQINGQLDENNFKEIRACCRSYYEYDEQIIFPESIYIDYKLYNWPIIQSQITRKIAIEILSFLNCNGGALLIGINDQDYRVKGTQLTLKSREEFQKYLDDKILCFIHPLIKNEVQVSFLPIKHGNTWKKNLYIIRVLIQQGKPDELYTFSSENYEMISSVRRQSSCFSLRQDQIKSEIQTRMKFPIRKIQPHICVQESVEGLQSSCQISDLEKVHTENVVNQNQQNDQKSQDELPMKIIIQLIQNNENASQLVKSMGQILQQNDIQFSKITQYKQIIFNLKKKNQCKQAEELLNSQQNLYNKHHECLLRITFQSQKIFQVEIIPSKVIIFSNIDRHKIASLSQFLMGEIDNIYILPLEYSFMIQVDDLKEAWNILNKKRKLLSKFSYKNVDVRYGISDNLKITISNLQVESLENFQSYFEDISIGIDCKGEDNDSQITLFFGSFIDYILASERLQFLMYSDNKFRQFGKNQKIYINLEIFSK